MGTIDTCEKARHWDRSIEADLRVLCAAALQHGLHDRVSGHAPGDDDDGGGLCLHLYLSAIS